MQQEKFKFWICHSKYSNARPNITSVKGNRVYFDFDRISTPLREKLYDKIDVVLLTIDEANEILNACSCKIISVSTSELNRLFN
jgi:hypothetical protein